MTDTTEEIFRHDDDDHPVTRGEMRAFSKKVSYDIRWAAALLLVGNQTLSHIELNPAVGFIGGVSFALLAGAKLVLGRGV